MSAAPDPSLLRGTPRPKWRAGVRKHMHACMWHCFCMLLLVATVRTGKSKAKIRTVKCIAISTAAFGCISKVTRSFPPLQMKNGPQSQLLIALLNLEA